MRLLPQLTCVSGSWKVSSLAVSSFLARRHTSRYRHFIKATGSPGFMQESISYKQAHSQKSSVYILKHCLNNVSVIEQSVGTLDIYNNNNHRHHHHCLLVWGILMHCEAVGYLSI